MIEVELWRWWSRRWFLLLHWLSWCQRAAKYVIAESTWNHSVNMKKSPKKLIKPGSRSPLWVTQDKETKEEASNLLPQINSFCIALRPGGRGAARVGIRISASNSTDVRIKAYAAREIVLSVPCTRWYTRAYANERTYDIISARTYKHTFRRACAQPRITRREIFQNKARACAPWQTPLRNIYTCQVRRRRR